MTTKLIQNLQKPELYDHPVNYFKLLQTHISWVILTGDYVYKIKKPVDFEFLNFTTLESREKYCKKELKLNKQLAPELYLDVVKITGSEENPEINGEGEVIEYAIKMREFPQDQMFNHLLEQGNLKEEQIEQVAEILANFHERAEGNGPEYFGTPEKVFEPVIQNFDQIHDLLTDEADLETLSQLRVWTEKENKRLYDILKERKEKGFIRACHGDIHLGNMTLYNHKPVIFDCIEFNESFRWTDTMGDTGFMVMDLHEHGKLDFANYFINSYFQASGDYHALHVLPYYQAYRAMVRAKVSLFELTQVTDPARRKAIKAKYHKFIGLVKTYAKPTKPQLLITHGFSGSGKSTIAKFLVGKIGALQIRSDLERKRLAGLAATATSNSGLYQDLYKEEVTEKTYQKLYDLAEDSLQAGYSVIVDATFLKENNRELFTTLADKLNIPYHILHCHAPLDTLLQWIDERKQAGSDVSEASKEVLLAQQEHMEALTAEELEKTISIDTSKEIDPESILKKLSNKNVGCVSDT